MTGVIFGMYLAFLKIWKNMVTIKLWILLISYLFLPSLLISATGQEDSVEQPANIQVRIINSMKEIIAERKEKDYQRILDKVANDVELSDFDDFAVQGTEPIGSELYRCVYGSGDLEEQDPETLPQQGTLVRLVSGSVGKKAFKINRTDELLLDSFNESVSIIYVQHLVSTFPGSDIFKFTPLEKVALYHQEDAQQRRMFMISECAPGHSIDNYVAIITTAEESSLEKFLWVISRTAMAFAQLHKRTERVLKENLILLAVARSYEATTERIKRHLFNFHQQVITNEIGITTLFYEFLMDIDHFSKHIMQKDNDLRTAFLRNTSLIHGDAHTGNVFYDGETDSVTFIDYSTAIESFKHDADPLKEIGCFLESVWLKLAAVDEMLPEQLYDIAVRTRNTLIKFYMQGKGEDIGRLEDASQRVKLYMWCQLFDFFYSLDSMPYPAETIECIKHFLRRDFS